MSSITSLRYARASTRRLVIVLQFVETRAYFKLVRTRTSQREAV